MAIEDGSSLKTLALGLDNLKECAPLLQEEPHSRFARKDLVAQWVPEVDPEHPRARTFRTWHSRRQVVLWTATVVAFVVFFINVITTSVFVHKFPPVQGIGTLARGRREYTSRISSGIHILINILSTLLLGASNMCMQLCVAPTRSELDRAHAKCQWLDIGTPSLRNTKWIHPWRVPLILILSLTSIPLHFLYNSAVFPSLAVNTYEWVVLENEYVSSIYHSPTLPSQASQPWNFTGALAYQDYIQSTAPLPVTAQAFEWQKPYVNRIHDNFIQHPHSFRPVSNLDCMTRYGTVFGNRSDLILVTKHNKVTSNLTTAPLFWMGNWGAAALATPGDWMCHWLGFTDIAQWSNVNGYSSDNCQDIGNLDFYKGTTLAERRKNRLKLSQHWFVAFHEIDYCLVSELPQTDLYTVDYSVTIMIVVCVANFCKCIGILATALWYRRHDDPPLSILGDAIASFLEIPDETTRRLGACSLLDIEKRQRLIGHGKAKDETRPWRYPPPPLEWIPKRHRWFHGASKGRWALAISLCLLVIVVSLGLLVSGIVAIGSGVGGISKLQQLKYVYSLKFGHPNPSALVAYLPLSTTRSALYRDVLFANSWQFAVSFLYLFLNALVSSMLVGNEWSHYARHRKPLRVSAPEGIQRSSFFISMPYKYGAPLMSAMSLLHWLISQSVFLVKVTGYKSTGERDSGANISAVGYSPIAITIALAVGILIVVGVCLLALKKYGRGMPLASTCSAAISAACHAPKDDYDARYFPVMWGVVERDPKGYVHCSFTTARDARPLGEPDDWKEKKEPQYKAERKAKKKLAKNEHKKRRKAEKEVKKDARISRDVWSPFRKIVSLQFWTALFSSSWEWMSKVVRGAFTRRNLTLELAQEHHTKREDEIVDIIAPWPRCEKY